MTFPTTLKTARLAAGLTMEQAADLLGVTRMTIHNWEAGKRTPPADPVLTQADILARVTHAPPPHKAAPSRRG